MATVNWHERYGYSQSIVIIIITAYQVVHNEPSSYLVEENLQQQLLNS